LATAVFPCFCIECETCGETGGLVIAAGDQPENIFVPVYFRQRYLFFYGAMILIGAINLLFQLKTLTVPYLFVCALGILFWLFCAIAAWQAYTLTQRGTLETLYATITLFFILHLVIIVIYLTGIMIDAGTINPYTYKGMNQRYYLSTGDFIRGISFDSPVTTAMICAFGLLFFLYRERYFLSVACMTGLLLIGSNLTDMFVFLVFIFMFVFRSNRAQKSLMVVFCCMFLVFVSKVSPQNNEYVVSFLYKQVGKAYYLPQVRTLTRDELKASPDSMLSAEQRRIKKGLLYIDSINAAATSATMLTVAKDTGRPFVTDTVRVRARQIFNEYRPTTVVRENESRFGAFLRMRYGTQEFDSLSKVHDWDKPGKSIAYAETIKFLRSHPGRMAFGAGVGNFSSRLAFKATGLNIAGSYPARYQYIHPYFMNDHLFLYLYYHAQWQMKHTAANTPDAAYNQLLGEYGVVGLLLFFVCYAGYFVRRRNRGGWVCHW
jgi:hypothetical protein